MKTTEWYHGFIEKEDSWQFRYRTADDGLDTGAFLCGDCLNTWLSGEQKAVFPLGPTSR